MAFKNMLLKAQISFGSSGGPSFRTDIVETESGIESRNQVWTYQRSKYELVYAPDVGINFKDLYEFFQVVQGSLHSFLIIDPLDKYAAPGEGVFVTSLGSPSQSQMAKRVTVQGYTATMLVTKPRQAGLVISGGSADAGTYTTGIVQGAPTAWYGYYYKHVRFDTDVLQPIIQNKKSNSDELIVGWETLPLIEVRGDNENT